jgi:hypothetical protein
MYSTGIKTALLAFFVFSFMMFIDGCKEDDIVTPASEHFEPEGLFILAEGNTSDTVVRVFGGVVNNNDTLKAPLNILTEHWEVFFWDANRNVLDPPSDGSHTLGFTIRDASVIQTVMDNPNDWAFHLKGLILNPDTTSMQIKVLHEGHADFTTPYIPVKVDPCAIPVPAGFVMVDTVTNAIVYRDSSGTITGDTIRVNVSGSTNRLKVFYLDEEGERYQPCESEYTLSAVFNPAGIASFSAQPGLWNFKIEGIAAGSTLFSLRLLRGSNLFYGSVNIPVKVL